MWVLFALSSGLSWGADPGCITEVGNEVLRDRVATAEAAVAALDQAALASAGAGLDLDVRCLGMPVEAATAAAIHRVNAVRSFLTRDEPGGRASFLAARAIEPTWELPPSLFPAGHPLRRWFDAALAPVAGWEDLPAIAPDSWVAEGRSVVRLPTDRPTILQRVGPDGRVVGTTLVAPGEPVPAWMAASPEVAVAAVVALPVADPSLASDLPPDEPKRRHPAVIVAGGALVLGAAGLYLGAWRTEAAYEDTTLTAGNTERLRALYTANHGLVVGSGVVGALGMAVGTLGLTARW